MLKRAPGGLGYPPIVCIVRSGLTKRAVLISWPSHLSHTFLRITAARAASSGVAQQ